MNELNKEELEGEISEVTVLDVSSEDIGKRIDQFVSSACDISRSAVVKLIENENLLVCGKGVSKNYKLRESDKIEIVFPEPESSEAEPEDIPLDIIYEDGDIIVVNKPKGMVVHPAPGNYSGTLVNALLYHCRGSLSGIGGVVRPGIVHRIDKDTAGLIVSAKNDTAHLFLAEEIKYHRVSRIYYAIVLGNFKDDSGTVNAPIGRHPVDRKRMAVVKDPMKNAKEAITHWSVVERFGRYTLVRCELETGRTHQIRVHMSSIGHPLMGDVTYGGGGSDFEKHNVKHINGQCLFAAELRLTHPVTKEKMTFSAEMPKDMLLLLEKLRGGQI